MIAGTHSVLYSKDPDADRKVLRDILKLPVVDGGGGYLIFCITAGRNVGASYRG